jgi:hypothetical protein
MFEEVGILMLVAALCVSLGQMALAKTVLRVAHTIAPDSLT